MDCKDIYFKQNRLNNLLCLSDSTLFECWKSIPSNDRKFIINSGRKFPLEFCLKYKKQFGVSYIFKNFKFKDDECFSITNNWRKISHYGHLSKEFILKYQDKIVWNSFIYNRNLSGELFLEFKSRTDSLRSAFNEICYLFSDNITLDIIKYIGPHCFSTRSLFTKRKVSEKLLVEIKDYISFYTATNINHLSINFIENLEPKYANQLNIAEWIKYNNISDKYIKSKINIYENYINSIYNVWNLDLIYRNKNYIDPKLFYKFCESNFVSDELFIEFFEKLWWLYPKYCFSRVFESNNVIFNDVKFFICKIALRNNFTYERVVSNLPIQAKDQVIKDINNLRTLMDL